MRREQKLKPMKQKSDRHRFFVGFFVAGVILWFVGGFVVGRFVEGKGEEDYSQQEGNVLGAQDFHDAVEDVFLENVFPVESPAPVRDAGTPDIVLPNAHASVILDADSGVLLYHEKGTDRRQIASLTKLMTGLLVMENVKDLDEVATITDDIYGIPGTVVGCPTTGVCNGPRMYPGERLTVRNLMRAMLMNSANDSAVALAVHVAGSQEKFVDMMNARAKELGLNDTHFCTPSGLEITGHETECYSSAYDIARIAAKALDYDEMWKIMRTPAMDITSVNGQRTHNIINTDKILDEYPGLVGTKTGFTPLAGRSLLAVAEEGDSGEKHRIVAVLLDDPYRWDDVKDMFAWTFDSYTWE